MPSSWTRGRFATLEPTECWRSGHPPSREGERNRDGRSAGGDRNVPRGTAALLEGFRREGEGPRSRDEIMEQGGITEAGAGLVSNGKLATGFLRGSGHCGLRLLRHGLGDSQRVLAGLASLLPGLFPRRLCDLLHRVSEERDCGRERLRVVAVEVVGPERTTLRVITQRIQDRRQDPLTGSA